MTTKELKAEVERLGRLQLTREEICIHLRLDLHRLDGGDLEPAWSKGIVASKVEARQCLLDRALDPKGTSQALVAFLKSCEWDIHGEE